MLVSSSMGTQLFITSKECVKMVGENIDSLKGMHGLTQSTLSKGVSVSQQCISGIRNGRRAPSLLTVRKISKFFGVTMEELLGNIETCLTAGLKSYETCPARSMQRGHKNQSRVGYSSEECAMMRRVIMKHRLRFREDV